VRIDATTFTFAGTITPWDCGATSTCDTGTTTHGHRGMGFPLMTFTITITPSAESTQTVTITAGAWCADAWACLESGRGSGGNKEGVRRGLGGGDKEWSGGDKEGSGGFQEEAVFF
jgi:hypothetical protein